MKQQQITHMNFYSGSGMWEKEAAALGWKNLSSCENNTYARKLLQLRFPDHDIIPDANSADARQYRGIIDVATFSPPCQGNSAAGKRLGADDPRNGLPATLRILDESRPTWAVVENVSGLLTVGRGLVIRDFLRALENLAYHPVVLEIPSGAAGAIHLRNRVWVVAYTGEKRCQPYVISTIQSNENKGSTLEYNYLAHATRRAAASPSALVGIYDRLPAGMDRHRANRIGLMGNVADPNIIRPILTAIHRTYTAA